MLRWQQGLEPELGAEGYLLGWTLSNQLSTSINFALCFYDFWDHYILYFTKAIGLAIFNYSYLNIIPKHCS